MNKFQVSFILTSLSGLLTLVGYLIIFLKLNRNKIIVFSLSLASSVMLTISLIDLLPSSYIYLNKYYLLYRLLIIIFFFLLGVFLSKSINKIFIKETNLKRIGIISLIAIIIHNIPEGIITFMVSGVNFSFGLELAIAISMHNIPEGISIAIPIYYSSKSKFKTFIYVLLAGLSEVFGAIICFFFLKQYINDFIIGLSFSFISGIMIYISIKELLKEAISYHYNKIFILGFFLGFISILISHFL